MLDCPNLQGIKRSLLHGWCVLHQSYLVFTVMYILNFSQPQTYFERLCLFQSVTSLLTLFTFRQQPVYLAYVNLPVERSTIYNGKHRHLLNIGIHIIAWVSNKIVSKKHCKFLVNLTALPIPTLFFACS